MVETNFEKRQRESDEHDRKFSEDLLSRFDKIIELLKPQTKPEIGFPYECNKCGHETFILNGQPKDEEYE